MFLAVLSTAFYFVSPDYFLPAKNFEVMTLAIYSALMKVYAYSGLYERACDLYEDIQKDGIAPDSMMHLGQTRNILSEKVGNSI